MKYKSPSDIIEVFAEGGFLSPLFSNNYIIKGDLSSGRWEIVFKTATGDIFLDYNDTCVEVSFNLMAVNLLDPNLYISLLALNKDISGFLSLSKVEEADVILINYHINIALSCNKEDVQDMVSYMLDDIATIKGYIKDEYSDSSFLNDMDSIDRKLRSIIDKDNEDNEE